MTGNANNWSRAALVVAHPSHELRVHGWMQRARPLVFVLTDGSGRAAKPRLRSTTKVLTDLGASAGSVYGRFTDLEVYSAFLSGDFSLFLRLAEELAEQFVHHHIEYVVADSDEGYSPTHDACRLLTNAALEIVRRRHNKEIVGFEYAVVAPPDECPEQDRERAIWLRLDDVEFFRKVSAVRAYDGKLAIDIDAALDGSPFNGLRRLSSPQFEGAVDTELSDQVVAAIGVYSGLEEFRAVFNGIELNRFRTECLRPMGATSEKRYSRNEPPFLEIYGKKMVAAGHYSKPIRYVEPFSRWKRLFGASSNPSEKAGTNYFPTNLCIQSVRPLSLLT